MKRILTIRGRWRRGAMVVCIVLSLMAYVLKFLLPG